MNVNETELRTMGTGMYKVASRDHGEGALFTAGDILEGRVLEAGKDGCRISLKSGDTEKEITLPHGAIESTYAGDKRQFKVMEAGPDRLVLKDLGSIASQTRQTMSMQFTAVNTSGLTTMVDDFAQANGSKEKEEEDGIKRLSDKDYSELRQEGFSIEDYKAEQLAKAIARVKDGLRIRRENAQAKSAEYKEERKRTEEQAAISAAEAKGLNRYIAESLVEADLPVTPERLEEISGALRQAMGAAHLTDSSYAYLIGNNLPPTAENLYKAAYGGRARREPLADKVWKELEGPAGELAATAGSTLESARLLVEYKVPLTEDSLIYKERLDDLKLEFTAVNEGRPESLKTVKKTIEAAIDAIYRGRPAGEALLMAFGSGRPEENLLRPDVRELEVLNTRLGLEEARLKLTVNSLAVMRSMGIEPDTAPLERVVEGLRDIEKQALSLLADEVELAEADRPQAVDLTQRTLDAVHEIRTAPKSLLAESLVESDSLTLEGLAAKALASKAYIASATEIRPDLGDSMRKAFDSIDSLLEANGLETTEANRSAVRALGYNGMELTKDNINEMKYFEAKVSGLIDSLKPSVVLRLIRQGVNPLETGIDELRELTDQLMEDRGYLPEEKYSSFLMRMDEQGGITQEEREAYVGIYRLLYQVEKSDGAAIGALVKSGKRLTLKNLLTEVRSAATSLDTRIDDEAEFEHTSFTNSITDQIERAIAYERSIVTNTLEITNPQTWQTALAEEVRREEGIESLTTEQVYEKLRAVDGEDTASAASAERIRAVMTDSGAVRRYLRSFGMDDSVNNIEAAGRSETPILGELADRQEDFEGSYIAALDAAVAKAEAGFAEGTSETGRLTGPVAEELTASLMRYGFLEDMARSRHFEFTLDDESHSRVKLTLISERENRGSISLEVRTQTYQVRAELRLMGGPDNRELTGSISCDGPEGLGVASAAYRTFTDQLTARGIETSGLSLVEGSLSDERFFSRLGEIKRRAEAGLNDAGGRPGARLGEGSRPGAQVETEELYRVSRTFLDAFLG